MERIICNKWRDLCDCIYDAPNYDKPIPNSIVFVPLDQIAKFFFEYGDNSNQYIILSANSDYGICYQRENPIWFDMKRWLDFIPIDESLGYNPLISPARCNLTQCKLSDKYSIKCHTFTKDTFDKIPSNIVKWFCTNCDIDDVVVQPIPFGIPEWSEKLIDGRDEDRNIGYYLNFQNNTAERTHIKARFKNTTSFVVVDKEISHEEFISNLYKSIYVPCPSGNGLDSYRVLETLYCGATPVLQDSRWSKAYAGLPAITVNNFSYLPKIAEEYGFRVLNIELEKTPADFCYWREKISQEKLNLP